MTLEIALPRNIHTQLANANTPTETQNVERVATTYAVLAHLLEDETEKKQVIIEATHMLMLARRKTYELVKPQIRHGGATSHDATLMDFGIDRRDWHRREREYEAVTPEQIEIYFDTAIAFDWRDISVKDVLRYSSGHKLTEEELLRRDIGYMLSAVCKVLTHKNSREQQRILESVLDIFKD